MSIPLRLGRVLRMLGIMFGVALSVVGLLALPGAALGGFVLGVFVGGGVAVRLQEHPASDAAAGRRAVRVAGLTAAGTWLVGTGVVVVLGVSPRSVAVAFVIVGLPAAFRLWRRFRTPSTAPEPTVQLPAVVPSPVLGTLTTPELCLAWRRSYLALLDLPAGPARGELVAVRQSMLDELERRDSDGFHRWLDAGARAGGDPARYLATGPGV